MNGTGTDGVGALQSNGNNSFAGVITLGSDSAIASTLQTLTLSGGIVNGGFTVTFGGDSNIAVTGVIDGTGGLVKNDVGILLLSQLNTYTGTTTVNGGILRIPVSDRLADTSDLVVSGGTFDLQGVNETVQNVTLASGSITGTGTATLTASSFSFQSGTATAILAGSGATLTKTTVGTVTLSGANTFTGATTVNGGTLTLSSTSGSALGSTSSVTVNSGGTVLLGANNQINDTAPMTLAGGTFAKGNFSEGSASTPGVGALTLTASGSLIDFGTGTVGVLTFESFTPGAFTLTIDNWTGMAFTQGSASTDRLIFAADQSANLGSFLFTGFAAGAFQFDLGGGFWEVTPVPEPSTWAGAGMAAIVVGWYFVRRRRVVMCPGRPFPMFAATCGVALLATTVFATPRDEINRAVAVNAESDVSEATQGQFLKAFTAVALRVAPDELPAYLTAAIELRPDLAPKAVTVAVKIAAKHGELKPQNLPTMIGKIMKAAIAAKPEAVVSLAEAGASALPHLRHYVVNAAIAAAPQAKEAIVNAAGNKTDSARVSHHVGDRHRWIVVHVGDPESGEHFRAECGFARTTAR